MYNNYNPYIGQQFQRNIQPQYNYQQPMQNLQQPVQPIQSVENYRPLIGLQGKVVESLDVIKATEIPLDGSISYFALTDGSAIATKQLTMDGKSKITVYKPIENEKVENNLPQYATIDELNKLNKDINDQISGLNSKEIKDIKEDIKTLKRGLEDVSDLIKDKKGK